jgi:hypothetical protein
VVTHRRGRFLGLSLAERIENPGVLDDGILRVSDTAQDGLSHAVDTG